MKQLLLIFILFHSFLIGYQGEEENPALFQHVNVITGDLNLFLEDTVIESPKPIPIRRSYTSMGALERNESNYDLYLKKLRGGFLIQGGWNYFPHTNLLIFPSRFEDCFKAYVSDRSGHLTVFIFSHKEKSHVLCMKPEAVRRKAHGKISAKSEMSQQRLYLDTEKGVAKLCLPDGSTWRYEGSTMRQYKNGGNEYAYYRLIQEKLPNGHQVQYIYNKEDLLTEVHYKNPSGEKSFASVKFDMEKTKSPYRFRALTSDGKALQYQFLKHKDRDYLCEFQKSGRVEKLKYTEGHSGLGARVSAFQVNDQIRFKVSYYLPKSETEEKKWREHPKKKPHFADKVSLIEAPYGPDGQMVPMARFTYEPDYTDVRDAENLLTRYHHYEGDLNHIECFDKEDKLISLTSFLRKEDRVAAKVECDCERTPVFSKTFRYDKAGNVVEEVLWGNLSGRAEGPFHMEKDGSLSGAESSKKTYVYQDKYNLLIEEKEEGGLSYKYEYAPNTDLLISKYTCYQDEILVREFLFYNEDHLLVAELVDDGKSQDPHIHEGMTHRTIKRYVLNDHGLPQEIAEYYLDLGSGLEILVQKRSFEYSSQHQVIGESIYDSEGKYRYVLETKYDEQGHVVVKTDPVGLASTYAYDSLGRLLRSIEPGNAEKIYTYDCADRPVCCEEIDLLGNRTYETCEYDVKGRLLAKIDKQGHATTQSYDDLGRCIAASLPQTFDEQGLLYTPILSFEYDNRGNVSAWVNPKGEMTRTSYTILRKPYRIVQPDGSLTENVYNKDGTLAKTIHSDRTEEHFSYDPFQRMVERKMFSPRGELLSCESWEYSAFHLLSYTNERGLTTRYFYDGPRLVKEEAEDRRKEYSYDPLGFLERVTSGGFSQVQIHDAAGRITKQWIEGASGVLENRMSFEYNSSNQKVKAYRDTSQGEAVDLFTYDGFGRLASHTDPLGNKIHLEYEDSFVNALGQRVLQKKATDPLGVMTIETYDVATRIVCLEKKDPNGKTAFKEEWLYDRAGNRAKQITTVYRNYEEIKTHEVTWKYDSCGRKIQEIEGDLKARDWQYDSKGRLHSETLPNSTTLNYKYDGKDRLVERMSSDGSVHDGYEYARGPEPVLIHDFIQNTVLKREYNTFGEVVEETSSVGTYRWKYDSSGRRTSFFLPDGSSIAYTYSDLHLTSVLRIAPSGSILYQHEYVGFDVNGYVAKERLIHSIGTLISTRDLLERPSSHFSPWLKECITYGASSLVEKIESNLFGNKNFRYDVLQQLMQEGEKEYRFDSVGNALDHEVNNCNQVIATGDTQLSYDVNGNPERKDNAEGHLFYKYDALGRLITFTRASGEEVHFTYDAFSRLVSKEAGSEKKYYLYDQETEIGSIDAGGQCLELKILGLGLKRDIGAAIALELQGEVYAPLHDFSGNIVALISPQGEMVESYSLTAFGEIEDSSPRVSPWVFCSKRSEEQMVFFGFRFYDPSLSRWLTPDPAGFSDGPNLYVYVLNSPLNRLDLFGLNSEFALSIPNVRIEVPISMIESGAFNSRKVYPMKGTVDGVEMDWFLSGGVWNHLHFSPEERSVGSINLLDHLSEMLPAESKTIGLVTFQNGIKYSNKECKGATQSIANLVPEGTLVLGIYNPTRGFFKDYLLLEKEIRNQETIKVARSRQIFSALSTTLFKVNPNLFWMHVAHSEGGVILERSIEGMAPEQKECVKKNLIALAYGAVHPISNQVVFEAINNYSKKDYAVQGYRKPFMEDPNYEIKMHKCVSPFWKRSCFIVDHAFMGDTYQMALERNVYNYDGKYGFFCGSSTR